MKRLSGFILAIVLGLSASAVLANTSPQDAQSMVKSTAEQLLKRLRADHQQLTANPDRIYPLVEDLVLPHFDFETMSRWVLGKYWRTATPAQRQEFTEQFRNLLVRTYAKALLEYDDQTLRYLPLQAANDARRVTVKTEVVQSGGPAIPINYSLYRKGDSWKVYDVVVDGVSLVMNYRSSFYSEIRSGGLDKLIAQLKQRNAQANGGSS